MALNIFLPPSENQSASFQFLLRVGRWVFPPSTCLGSSCPETLFSYQGQGQVGGSPLEWTLQCCLLQRKTNQEDCNVSTYQKEDKPHQKNYQVIINSSWAVYDSVAKLLIYLKCEKHLLSHFFSIDWKHTSKKLYRFYITAPKISLGKMHKSPGKLSLQKCINQQNSKAYV